MTGYPIQRAGEDESDKVHHHGEVGARLAREVVPGLGEAVVVRHGLGAGDPLLGQKGVELGLCDAAVDEGLRLALRGRARNE